MSHYGKKYKAMEQHFLVEYFQTIDLPAIAQSFLYL